MSDCDGMSITIQNEASGADGKPIKVEIQGLNPWKTSTLTGFSVGQFIDASGGTAAGNAKSGSGTDGKASGTIQVAAVWDSKTGPEILNLNYQGSPGNDLGWYGCSPQPASNSTPHFYVTTSAQSGKGGACQQVFYIRNY